MLPTGHISFTWAVLNLVQRRTGHFVNVDYRLIAACTLLPDALDKPLATFVMTETNAALLYGHTLLFHGGVWLAGARSGRLRKLAPYLLALSGHLLADRMWGFTQTLFWPVRGRQFHQWQHVGSPKAILEAYRRIIVTEPKLIAFEIAGALLMTWFVVDRQLWRRQRAADFLRTGRVEKCRMQNAECRVGSGR